MRELHHKDGRPFSFDPNAVIFFEAHQSGDGTLLRIGPGERWTEMHVLENYETVEKEIRETNSERALARFVARGGQTSASFMDSLDDDLV